MISEKEIKVLDINSEFYKTPAKKLMENAGKGLSDFIKNELKIIQKNILFFCGMGNNGGDGFVAARHISQKNNVTVFIVGKENNIKTKISKENFQKLKKLNIKIYNIESIGKIKDLIQKSDLIVDSMLGIGISGPLREPYNSIVKQINKEKNKIKISVDIPTGFKTDNSVKPHYTVTFHDVKFDMDKKNCGIIKIVDIKIPEKAIRYVGPGELNVYYPMPKKDSHKGENGNVLIIGGGPYHGAPALSSFAAQRTGSDLIYIATPKKVAQAITSYSPLIIKPNKLAKELAKISPNLIVKELNDENVLIEKDIEIIKGFVNKIDSLLIGPGLGTSERTQRCIEKIIRLFLKQNKPVVIDADAIKVVGKNHSIIKNKDVILTPHLNEFKELTGVKLSKDLDERIDTVKKWAKKLGVTILLKGPVDIISNGEDTKLNDVHNVSMTVGGTGDVLAGITSSLLSKGVNSFNSARIAIFINGYAGNLAFKKRSYGVIATDIIEEIPNVLKQYL